jgi:transposase IS66-like protein
MHVIGEETSRRLDVIPAQFRMIVTHRPKYACGTCEQAMMQAPAPELAYVLVAKYALASAALCCSPKASTSSVRSWRSGWAMRPPNSSRSTFGCASSSWPRARSRSMRARRRCSIPATAPPRKATSGRSPETTGPGAEPIRPPSPTGMPPVVAPCTSPGSAVTVGATPRTVDGPPAATPIERAQRSPFDRRFSALHDADRSAGINAGSIVQSFYKNPLTA